MAKVPIGYIRDEFVMDDVSVDVQYTQLSGKILSFCETCTAFELLRSFFSAFCLVLCAYFLYLLVWVSLFLSA